MPEPSGSLRSGGWEGGGGGRRGGRRGGGGTGGSCSGLASCPGESILMLPGASCNGNRG